MSHYKLKEVRHGRYLFNTHDTYIGRSLDYYGEWSDAEIWLFGQIVRPGDTVLEAGANIGAHTVWLSRAVAHGQVFAFEPARHTHQLLCANLALNGCLNVHALQQAIGSQNTSVDFPLIDPGQPNNFGAVSLISTTGFPVEKVPQVTLDTLALDRLDFIKADIEGMELQLLQGGLETIARHRPVLYLEMTAQEGSKTGNRDALLGLLSPLHYQAYYFIAPMFNPQNFFCQTDDIFNAVSLDILCVPHEKVEVLGLSQAQVGDGRLEIGNGAIGFEGEPWSSARLRYR